MLTESTHYNFTSLIENKCVCLVGPADFLEKIDNKDNLKKINGSDVVIKINRGLDLSEKYPHLIGKRTDILYNTLLENCVNGGILDIEKIKQSRIKHIRTIPKSDMKGNAYPNSNNISKLSTLQKLEMLHSLGTPTTVMKHDFFTQVSRKVDCRPTTGFAAVYDILAARPKSLYITGFSFFLGGPLKGYWGGSEPGGIEEEWGHSEEVHAERVFNSTRHVHKNMWSVFKQEILPAKVVSMDPIMEKIFLLEKYDRNEYNKIIEDYSWGS
jgi:hypothetical protein